MKFYENKPTNFFNDKQKSEQQSNQFNSKKINYCLEEIMKNKEIKEYIPKKNRKNKASENPFDLNINAPQYIPSQIILENQEKAEKEKEERQKLQKEREEKIKKDYLYSYEYLMQFETCKISNETDLLPKETLDHINEIELLLKKNGKFYAKQNSKISDSNCNTSISSSSTISVSLEKWAKKDYSTEIKAAEENKKKLKESDDKNLIKNELMEILNIMTKDNFDEQKNKILNIIKIKLEYQEQFSEIFFLKSVKEKIYAELHAKLVKFLNKELQNGNESSIFKNKVVDKCKDLLRSENFDKYIKEENPEERKNKIKKIFLGNIDFLIGMLKNKILNKKNILDCIEFMLKRFKNEKEKTLKLIFGQAYINLVDKFATYIHSERSKMKPENWKKYTEKIEECFQNMEKIKNEETIPTLIKCLIINLMEKKKNNYEESKYEKSLKAKSKKELEEDLKNKDEKEEIKEEEKEKKQEEINKNIKKDVSEYKEYIEEKGTSKGYPWSITTELYDVQYQAFDDIVEGYIVCLPDFIEKKENIKYAKDYIKELISYYNGILKEQEKIDLRKRIFNMFDLVNDFAFETPEIFDMYSYILNLFAEYGILEIKDQENIYNEEMSESDITIISKVLQKVNDYNKRHLFLEELKKFDFIHKNKNLFKWVFTEE